MLSAPRPILLALVSAALFGAATPLSKLLLQEFSPFQLAGLLYLGAAIGVAPAALRENTRRGAVPGNALKLLGAIAFGGVLGPVLLLLGLRLASAASVSLWLNMELVATAVLGCVIFHDHLGRTAWLGVLGTACAGVLLSIEETAAGPSAGLLVALACLCWAFDNHFTALIDGITPTRSTFWKGLVAGSVNLLIGLASAPFMTSAAVTASALLLGALSYGLSIVLYITAAQRLGASRGQTIFASAPFFGVALAAIILREPVSAHQLLAGAVFAASVAFVFREQHSHLHEHAPLAHVHVHRHDDGHHTHSHPGEPPSLCHSHWHEHPAWSHTHPHWPDLHHRHPHGSSQLR